jgi:hypothetical protein
MRLENGAEMACSDRQEQYILSPGLQPQDLITGYRRWLYHYLLRSSGHPNRALWPAIDKHCHWIGSVRNGLEREDHVLTIGHPMGAFDRIQWRC